MGSASEPGASQARGNGNGKWQDSVTCTGIAARYRDAFARRLHIVVLALYCFLRLGSMSITLASSILLP